MIPLPEEVRDLGATARMIYLYLDREGLQAKTDIMSDLSVGSATARRSLKELVACGMVAERPHPDDKRKRRYVLREDLNDPNGVVQETRWSSSHSAHYSSREWEKKANEVRERDGHVCQNPKCGMTKYKHRKKYGQNLEVHHLRKAREFDDPEERDAKENLITLCIDCHQRWEQIADAGLVPQVEAVAD